MKPRKILPKLEKELKTDQITVITGMRRVGKTTILRHLFDQVPENKLFLDIEDVFNRKIFEEQKYDNIWNYLEELGLSKNSRAYLFLDEIQYVKNIPSVIKYTLSGHVYEAAP